MLYSRQLPGGEVTSGDNSEIIGLHKRLVQELHDLEDDIQTKQARLGKLRTVVENLEGLYVSLPQYSAPAKDGTTPRGREAVLRVLQDAAGRWLTIRDITSELHIRRWLARDSSDPDAAVRASLRRLMEAEAPIAQTKRGRTVLYQARPTTNAHEHGAPEMTG
jgi:hypothetical protein